MTRSSRRAAAALLMTATLLLPLAGTASAGSSSLYRSSGQTASADWIEHDLDDRLGLPGNVHVGFLFVDAFTRGRADVWGVVTDWDCEPGQTPGGGGHHGVEDEPGPVEDLCAFVGDRYISNRDAVFTMDRKATAASLVGTLEVVGGHGDGPVATPPVDMTWTAIGDTFTSRVSESYSDGTTSYTYRYTFTGADAAIGGRIGGMGFADDVDDQSSGSMGSYRNMYRERVR